MSQVQKKDGSLVDYDQNKIIAGILRAGGTQEDAQAVAASIDAWLPTVVVNDVVTTSDLRIKVLEELKLVNPVAAVNFESYKKA